MYPYSAISFFSDYRYTIKYTLCLQFCQNCTVLYCIITLANISRCAHSEEGEDELNAGEGPYIVGLESKEADYCTSERRRNCIVHCERRTGAQPARAHS